MRGTVNYCKELLYTDKDNERVNEINEWIESKENSKAVVTLGLGVTFFDLLSMLQLDKNRIYLVVSSDKEKRVAGFIFFGEYGVPLFFGSLGGKMAKNVHAFEDVAFSAGTKQTWCLGEVRNKNDFSNNVETMELESFLRAFLLSVHI